MEAGYLKEKDFRPSAFWRNLDHFTRDIFLFKLLPLELRAVVVLASAILVLISLIWMLFQG
jgi:hypothetical protein